MTGPSADSGPSAAQLWGAAWVLALIALGSVVRLVTDAANGAVQVQTEHVVWASVCVVAAAFSACCAVLVGVKSAEARLLLHLRSAETG